MELVDDGVRVELRIDPGPTPSRPTPRRSWRPAARWGSSTSSCGPNGEGEPYLEDGDVIPQDHTSIPVPVEQMLLNLDQFVGSIDQENLRIVIEELGRAFEGSGDDLGRLIDNGDLLLARAEQSLPQTLKLITDGQTVLDTQRDSRSAIRQWASDLRLVTDTLVEMDPDLRSIVVNAPDAGEALQGLVEDAGPGLGSLVRNLDILNQVQIPRLDGIQQMLITYPDAVSGGFTVVRRDEDGQLRSHFGFVLNSGDPHSCRTGYVDSGPPPARARSRTSTPTPSPAGSSTAATPTRRRLRRERVEHPWRAEHRRRRRPGTTTPEEQVGGGAPPPPTSPLSEMMGELLHANPIATLTG